MDLNAFAADMAPSSEEIEDAVAQYLPVSAVSFSVWMELEWADYSQDPSDVTGGEVLAAGLRDWRGEGAPPTR